MTDQRTQLGTQFRQIEAYCVKAGYTTRTELVGAYLGDTSFEIRGIGAQRRQLLIDMLFTLRDDQWARLFSRIPLGRRFPNATDDLDTISARSELRMTRSLKGMYTQGMFT